MTRWLCCFLCSLTSVITPDALIKEAAVPCRPDYFRPDWKKRFELILVVPEIKGHHDDLVEPVAGIKMISFHNVPKRRPRLQCRFEVRILKIFVRVSPLDISQGTFQLCIDNLLSQSSWWYFVSLLQHMSHTWVNTLVNSSWDQHCSFWWLIKSWPHLFIYYTEAPACCCWAFLIINILYDFACPHTDVFCEEASCVFSVTYLLWLHTVQLCVQQLKWTPNAD